MSVTHVSQPPHTTLLPSGVKGAPQHSGRVNWSRNRGEVLSSAGWKFVWLTEGEGWKSMQNSLRVGAEYIGYVINAHLLRKGLLEKIILAP